MEEYSFKKVDQFKCLESIMIQDNDTKIEILMKLQSKNKCDYEENDIILK